MGQSNEIKVFGKKMWIIGSIAVSGICWFFANELSGDFGWLMWVAPVAVIFCSFYVSGKITFLIAFIAYFIGRLSWFSYLVSVVTVVPTILFLIVLSLIFALIAVANRTILLSTKAWYSIFTIPVLFTAFELLLMKFSPDGTAGSIAYSQSNYLPVIQIASITGILGITFLVTLIPSAIATFWYFKKEGNKVQFVLSVSGLILGFVILFGIIRISKNEDREKLIVGLAVLDEKFHDITDRPDFKKEKLAMELYAKQIIGLAAQGAKMVVLPERAININKETEKEIVTTLCKTAKQNQVFIIMGYTNFTTDIARNSDLVIDENGNVVVNYNKVHLIKGLEDQFKIGDKIGLFSFGETVAGTAICKDLDFPDYINKYRDVTLMAVPAWDFVVDGWLHSRMAVLRGVENGFYEIRTARQGRLTINDVYGRVTYEADCSDGKGITLLGSISLLRLNTFYSRFGNWFGLLNLAGAAFLLAQVILKKDKIVSTIGPNKT